MRLLCPRIQSELSAARKRIVKELSGGMLQIGAPEGRQVPKPKKRFAGESDVPEPVEMTGCLFSHQVFEHHLIERGIVAVSDELPRLFLVEAARFPEEMEKGAPAVFQVRQPMLDPGRTERVD